MVGVLGNMGGGVKRLFLLGAWCYFSLGAR